MYESMFEIFAKGRTVCNAVLQPVDFITHLPIKNYLKC